MIFGSLGYGSPSLSFKYPRSAIAHERSTQTSGTRESDDCNNSIFFVVQ